MVSRPPFILSVGTGVIAALWDNLFRTAWSITMPSTTKIAGNTGRVHVGKGAVPNTTLSDPAMGIILIGGENVTEKEAFPGDPNVFKGTIWVVASVAAQIIEVEEDISEVPIERRAAPVIIRTV